MTKCDRYIEEKERNGEQKREHGCIKCRCAVNLTWRYRNVQLKFGDWGEVPRKFLGFLGFHTPF